MRTREVWADWSRLSELNQAERNGALASGRAVSEMDRSADSVWSQATKQAAVGGFSAQTKRSRKASVYGRIKTQTKNLYATKPDISAQLQDEEVCKNHKTPTVCIKSYWYQGERIKRFFEAVV